MSLGHSFIVPSTDARCECTSTDFYLAGCDPRAMWCSALSQTCCPCPSTFLSQVTGDSSCAYTKPVSQGCMTLDSTGFPVTFCSLVSMGPVHPRHRRKPRIRTSLVLPNTEGDCPEGWEVAQGDPRKQRNWWIREHKCIFTSNLLLGMQEKVQLLKQHSKQQGRR